MASTRSLIAGLMLAVPFVAGAFLPAASQERADAAAGPSVFIELEGQRVFGASDFATGFVPTSFLAIDGPDATVDEGDGWGGAAALGLSLGNGWSVTGRYRRLEADSSSGPYDPGVMAFAPGITYFPGGIPFGVLGAETEVTSRASFVDVEVSKDVGIGTAQIAVYGGVSYAEIDRDVSLACACLGFALVMGHDFEGVGPKVGFRGAIPLSPAISLVGGGSVAALFGRSKFTSYLDDPGFPPFAFKDGEHRTVAALNGEAGVAVAFGVATLTVGYRVDALLDALDTSQRVTKDFSDLGFPEIGDAHSDFVEHGPFARLKVPLTAGN